MSIYGKVKRVGSSSFQFDRVYSSRLDMEYVLNNDGTKASARKDGVYVGRYVLVEYGERYGADQQELDSYIQNREKDIQEYGNTYDSTVWQKVYENNKEKYIMVAELNATVPQLSLNLQKPLQYEIDNSSNDKYYILDGGKLKSFSHVKETYLGPTITRAYQTDDSFIINYPQPLQLEVNNKNINFNQSGFDMAYSHNLGNDNENVIAWATNDIIINSEESISDTQQADTKSLYMKVPIFGKTVSALYDLLYGYKNAEEIRPYLRQFRDNYYLNSATVDELETFLGYSSGSGKTLEDLRAEILTVNDKNQNKLDTLTSSQDILMDKWLATIPDLGEVLGNNSEGLLGLFNKIFGTSDPLTGITRFYLYSDWMNDANINENSPAIINKPLVIGGKDSNDKFSGGHYNINFDAWKLEGEPNTEIKAYCEASLKSSKEPIPVIQLGNKVYLQTETDKTVTIKILFNIFGLSSSDSAANPGDTNIATYNINTSNLINDGIPVPKTLTFTKTGFKNLKLEFYLYQRQGQN